MKIIGLRPKISLSDPKYWLENGLHVSRKLVPDQKPSMAVPCNTVVIFGIATESDVASRAAMSVITSKEMRAKKNLHPGLKVVA